MRKIFSILLAFLVLLFGAQSILAVDNDYKNSLLKIEINEKSPNDYNIGLYTKKIYNEPVKIIRKSDTIYYFLLPETNHAITSTPSGGAIKNILVKTYPYAGQDMNNGYTKVAIITTKPINLSTSLKTLDASVSPRLDPARLARLDNVFERYSERLAQNNIPTPLSEFRKTASIQTPSIKSNVNVVSNDKPVSIASTKGAKSFEEYQNQRYKEQAALNAASNKQQVQKSQQAAPTKQVKQTTPITVAKQAAPVKQVVATKPITPAVQTKQSSKPAEAPKQTVKKEAVAQVQPKQPEQKALIASLPKVNTKQNTPEQASKMPVEANEQDITDNIKTKAPQKIASTNDGKLNLTPKEISERIKPIVIDKPVDMKFEQKEENVEENKETNLPLDTDIQEAPVQQEQNNTKSKSLHDLIPHIALLMLLGGIYIIYKTNKNKKNETIASERMYAQASMPNIKEKFQKKQEVQNVSSNQINEAQSQETAQNNNLEVVPINETVQDTNYNEQIAQNETGNIETYPYNADSDTQNREAFNEYMNSVQEVQEVQENEDKTEQEQVEYNLTGDEDKAEIEDVLQDDSEIEPDFLAALEDNSEDELENSLNEDFANGDEVIDQLYTPIETPVYEEENEPVSYEEYKNEENQPLQDSADSDDDVATIVSSSKLTETRGLYLAKFGGATSLVGYIQDDIYVLYNFGEEEITDTEIKSTLAQENATDSLYLVKTGGKKLMVKSTPYNMSLEMVM